ncbi:MAG: DUF3800 domain-containing protein [Gammaproteobacteria bacterium]|nr:DUF3800 domain-containing protein [Gammaproteobacteria bacterium]
MKFLYVDESGSKSEGDIFVMAGLMIDAYKLRKYTENLDSEIVALLSKYPTPKTPKELKTKAFINGSGHWGKVHPDTRKEFLRNICRIAASCSKIYAISISFSRFDAERGVFSFDSWLAASMYISSLVQKRMKKMPNNKGQTVLIFDDNKAGMPKLSDLLYKKDPWFDGLYQFGLPTGKSRKNTEERFDQIINTAFSINSEHSSFIQASDAVSYIYRRNLEINSVCREKYPGERKFYGNLVSILDKRREKIGRVQECDCVRFYENIKHPHWNL